MMEEYYDVEGRHTGTVISIKDGKRAARMGHGWLMFLQICHGPGTAMPTGDSSAKQAPISDWRNMAIHTQQTACSPSLHAAALTVFVSPSHRLLYLPFVTAMFLRVVNGCLAANKGWKNRWESLNRMCKGSSDCPSTAYCGTGHGHSKRGFRYSV